MAGRASLLAAVAGVLAAAPMLVALRGFTVDDALIPPRYAAHLAMGHGYRFSAGLPASDGVTPLGLPFALAPFAWAGGGARDPTAATFAALAASRAAGAAAWLAASAILGHAIEAIGGARARYLALLLVAASAPLAAWSVAGLETGFAAAIATACACTPAGRPYAARAAALAGALAWLRPEALAFASVVGLVRAREHAAPRARAAVLALATCPFLVAAAVRVVVFGRAAPLAVLAKPSDLEHGAAYVGAGLLLGGAPLAAFAPRAWARLPEWPRALVAASAAHLSAVIAVGGDWMPLSRLLVPILAPLTLVAAHLLARGSPWDEARVALAVIGQLWAVFRVGGAAARVSTDRAALIASARGPLAGARAVATIDVGWVGAATPADVVDLAGVTDLEIAALPGGHTSKAVGAWLLDARGADRLVLQLAPGADPRRPTLARVAERRLAIDPRVAASFVPVATTPEGLPVRYVILARR